MKKRIFSLMLAVMMMVSMLPVTALAGGGVATFDLYHNIAHEKDICADDADTGRLVLPGVHVIAVDPNGWVTVEDDDGTRLLYTPFGTFMGDSAPNISWKVTNSKGEKMDFEVLSDTEISIDCPQVDKITATEDNYTVYVDATLSHTYQDEQYTVFGSHSLNVCEEFWVGDRETIEIDKAKTPGDIAVQPKFKKYNADHPNGVYADPGAMSYDFPYGNPIHENRDGVEYIVDPAEGTYRVSVTIDSPVKYDRGYSCTYKVTDSSNTGTECGDHFSEDYRDYKWVSISDTEHALACTHCGEIINNGMEYKMAEYCFEMLIYKCMEEGLDVEHDDNWSTHHQYYNGSCFMCGHEDDGSGGSGSGGDTVPYKLLAPTELEWGPYYYENRDTEERTSFDYNGMISWKNNTDQPDHQVLIKVYNSETGKNVWESLWYVYRDGREYQNDWDFVDFEADDLPSGSYYFTAQAAPRENDTSCIASEVVKSEDWEYINPDKNLPAPTNLRWEGDVPTWDPVIDANTGGYAIDIDYSATDANATDTSQLQDVTGYVWYFGEGNTDTFFELFDHIWEEYGKGYYYFTVETISADVEVISRSAYSALSPAYYYDPDNSGESGGGDTTTYYDLSLSYDDSLCTVRIYDSNDQGEAIQHVFVTGNGNTGKAPAGSDLSFEIYNIKDGYRIKSVTLNGKDRTKSFINGGYGELHTSHIEEGYSLVAEMEPVPAQLPSVSSITLYTDERFENVAPDHITYSDGNPNDRLYGKPTFADGKEYPGYYSKGQWEYSTDGKTWHPTDSWGHNRYDFWAGWQHHEELDFVNDSYDIRLRSIAKDLYTTGDDVYSNVIHINGGASGGSGGGEVCSHSGGKATCTDLAICDKCKQPYGELADHIWESKWSSSESGHFHACSNEKCGEIKDLTDHVSNNETSCDAAEKCSVCEFVLRAAGSHAWDSKWSHDEQNHWHKCSVCGDIKDENAHTTVIDEAVAPGLGTDGKTEGSHCGVCGRVLVAQEDVPALQKQVIGFTIDDSITYTYGDVDKVYNDAWNDSVEDCEFTYTSSNENVAVVTDLGSFAITGTGTAVITAVAPAAEGYVETSTSFTLVINKKAVSITANDVTVEYGQTIELDKENVTITGVLEGDTVTVASGKLSAEGKAAGSYVITASDYVLGGDDAGNYEISGYANGTLTINKAAAHTITLGNLSQRVGNVTAVTAVLAPADETATVLVEYEILTPAVPCGHVHEPACGENGASCTHEHDEVCGYAEAAANWVTELPTAKGSYNVRASLTASDNIVIGDAPVYTTGVLEIKAGATIGGGGGSAAAPDNDMNLGSGGEDVSVDVEVKDDTVEIKVSDKELEQILDKVPATGEVVVDLTSVDGAKEVVLPSNLINGMNDSEDVKELTVVSESAEITMGEDVLKKLAETTTGTNDKVSVELTSVDKKDLNEDQQKALDAIAKDAVIVEMNLVVTHYDDKGNEIGSDKLHQLGGKVDVRIDYKLPDGTTPKNIIVSYVSDDGSVTYIRAKYIDGQVVFTTNHFSVYAVHTSYAAAFDDIDMNEWYASAVEYVAANGLMNGISETAFDPNSTTTRGMIVTILYRMEGQPAVSGGAAFADVSAEDYWADAVAWAAANNIVTGYSSDKFGPNDPITREQMAAILYRYAQYKGHDVSVGEDTNILSYNDAFEISEYAIPAIQWVCGEGILTGMGNGMLAPGGSATRAQIAAFMYRFCEKLA